MRVKGKRGWVDSDGFDQGPGRRLDTTLKIPMLPEHDFFRASIKKKSRAWFDSVSIIRQSLSIPSY